jgi:hypothetical protein
MVGVNVPSVVVVVVTRVGGGDDDDFAAPCEQPAEQSARKPRATSGNERVTL